MTRKFVDIGTQSYEMLAYKGSMYLVDKWEKKPYLGINVQETLTDLLQKLDEGISKIHPSYATKAQIACLQRVATHYIQTFICSVE